MSTWKVCPTKASRAGTVLLVSQYMVGGGKNTTSKWLATAVAQPRWPIGKSGRYHFPCASHAQAFWSFLGAIKRHKGQYSAQSKITFGNAVWPDYLGWDV